MGKSLFRSKTIGANTLAVGVALWQYYYGAILPADPQVFALAVAVVNIALRFATTQPIVVAR